MLSWRNTKSFKLTEFRNKRPAVLLFWAVVTLALGWLLIDYNRSTHADVASDYVGGNYRFFENQDNIAPGSPLAAANTPAEVTATSPDFRMRLGLENHAATNLDAWEQQSDSMQHSGTTWERIDSSAIGDVLAITDGIVDGTGQYFVSDDYGVSWFDNILYSQQFIDDQTGDFYTADVAVSADGQETAAVGLDYYGSVKVSIGPAMELVLRDSYFVSFSGGSMGDDIQLAASSDLSRLAVQYHNEISYSLDKGNSWNYLSAIYPCGQGGVYVACSATAIAISGDGSTLMVGTSENNSDYEIFLLDLDTMDFVDQIALPAPTPGAFVQSVDISDDGSHWVAIDSDTTVYVDGVYASWIGNNGSSAGTINTIAMSGNGMRFVFSFSGVAGSADVVVCDVSMQACGDINNLGGFIRDVTMSYTGSNAAAATGGQQYGFVYGFIWTYSTELLSPVLQYAEKTAGTCSAQSTGWTNVSSATDVQWNTNASVTSGAQISGTGNDPSATSGFPYVYQSYASSASGAALLSPIDMNNSGLWDFSLTVDSGVTGGTSFCLRLAQTRDDNTVVPFNSYNSYPEIAVASGLTVTSISPTSGPAAGGQTVTITGTNLDQDIGWKQISVGQYHTCAISMDDKVYCWGFNNYGQLGDNSTTNRSIPVPINDGSGGSGTTNNTGLLGGVTVAQISTSYSHTCAVTTAGKAYCWGYNNYGQLGDNSTTNRSIPVPINDGSGGTYPANNTGLIGGVTVAQISAGQSHTCAVTTAGKVYCWGNNGNGQLGDNSTTNRSIPVPINDGSGGSGTTNNTGLIGGVTVAQISAGNMHTCAMDLNSRVYCWGRNNYGQLGDNSTTNRSIPVPINDGSGGTYPANNTGLIGGVTVAQISAGQVHTCAVTAAGKAYCWGYNIQSQLGDNSTTQRQYPVPINDGSGGTYPANNTGLIGGVTVAQISAGQDHTCALTAAGKAYCWGYNAQGQLGDNSRGSGTNRLYPVLINDGSGGTYPANNTGLIGGVTVAQISAGQVHTCAVTAAGKAYCWGYNTYGQLGNGNITNLMVPVAVDTTNLPKIVPTVTIGGSPCLNVTVISDTELTCVTSSHAPGTVDVSVTVNGQTGTLINGYTYISLIIQTNYRFYDNANSLTPGSPRANQNTVASVGQPGVIGEEFRLRTGIVNETDRNLNSTMPNRTTLLSAITLAASSMDNVTLYYTSTSGPLVLAYNDAVAVFLDPNATQSQINSAQSAIMTAITGLYICSTVGPSCSTMSPITPPTSADAPPAFTPSLQFAAKTAATCPDQTTGWTSVTASSAIAYKTNPGATNGAVISSYANDPTSPTGSWNYQTYVSDPTGFVTVGNITPGQAALWDFSLVNLSTVATTNYCFRIVDSGNPLDQYDQYPEIVTSDDQYITISSAAGVNINVDPNRISFNSGDIVINTNATPGYTLQIGAATNTLVNGSYTIPSLASTATPAAPVTLSAGTSAWGFHVNGLGGFNTISSPQTNLTSSTTNWAAIPTTAATIRTGTTTDTTSIGGSNTPQSTTVWYGVGTSASQASGTYTRQITVTAVTI